MSSYCISTRGEVNAPVQAVIKDDVALTMIRPFRGMILKQDIKILDANQDYLLAQSSDVCKFWGALGSFVRLHSKDFSSAIVARLTQLDCAQGTIMLSDLAWEEKDWQERHHERVQPQTPVYARVHHGRSEFTASLENISPDGACILIRCVPHIDIELNLGDHIRLDFQLPPSFERMYIKGRLVYLKPVRSPLMKAGLSLTPTVPQARWLSRYVTRRREEILGELTASYTSAQRPRETQDLFF